MGGRVTEGGVEGEGGKGKREENEAGLEECGKGDERRRSQGRFCGPYLALLGCGSGPRLAGQSRDVLLTLKASLLDLLTSWELLAPVLRAVASSRR